MAHLFAVDGKPADVTVDLREVTFVNFLSLHALVSFSELLEPGRRLIVHTRSPAIAQVLAACGWDRPELPLTLLEEITDE